MSNIPEMQYRTYKIDTSEEVFELEESGWSQWRSLEDGLTFWVDEGYVEVRVKPAFEPGNYLITSSNSSIAEILWLDEPPIDSSNTITVQRVQLNIGSNGKISIDKLG